VIDPSVFVELAGGLNHPEGVVWNPVDGRVYAGGEGGEIYAVTLAGDLSQVGVSGGSMLGLTVDGRGRVYACDEGNGEVVRWDPQSSTIESYARGVDGRSMDTPNMAAFGPDGMLYVTCSGEDGRPEILRVAPGGEPVEQWTVQVPGYPNGCLVTPFGAALVVVESHEQRLVRVPIQTDGSAGRPVIVANLPDTDADGVALDAEGNYWVTYYRPDGIARVTPAGEVELAVDDHLAHTFDAPTNLCWVGGALDRAVIANVGDRFLAIGDLGAKGQPLHLPTAD
jgi:gluconolactonase